MASKTAAKKPDTPAPSTAANSNRLQDFAKIQDILFGEQVNEFESRFEALEQSLNASNDTLKQTFSERLTKQDIELKEELSRLNAWLKTEESARQADTKALNEKLAQQADSFTQALTNFKEETAQNFSTLKEEHTRDLAALSEKLELSNKLLNERLDAASAKLQDEKTDRRDLANLFESLAQTLRA